MNDSEKCDGSDSRGSGGGIGRKKETEDGKICESDGGGGESGAEGGEEEAGA